MIKQIKKDVYNFFVDKKVYPQTIRINPDLFTELQQNGSIRLTATTLLGIHIELDEGTESFTLI
ncbi:MAG: hypothetical protein ACI4XL_00875 [Bacillus sp. (in: firmicutes)]